MSSRTLDALPRPQTLYWPFAEDVSSALPPGTDGNAFYRGQHESILFSLPRELRDLIYTHLLEAHRRSPPSPPFSGTRILRRNSDHTPMKDISYSVKLPQANHYGILATCHAMRDEVLELAGRRNGSGLAIPAELDLMAKGYVFYPTWTKLPVLLSKSTLLDLDVRLRIFSPESFRENDGWPRQPGVGFRILLTLLNQFIGCGPAFTAMGDSSDPVSIPRVRIKTLTLRISNRDIYTGRMFPPAVYQTVRMCKALAARGDARRFIEDIKILVEDQDVAIPGSKEWHFDVSEIPDAAQIEAWEKAGFSLEAETANFRVNAIG